MILVVEMFPKSSREPTRTHKSDQSVFSKKFKIIDVCRQRDVINHLRNLCKLFATSLLNFVLLAYRGGIFAVAGEKSLRCERGVGGVAIDHNTAIDAVEYFKTTLQMRRLWEIDGCGDKSRSSGGVYQIL